MNPQPKLTYSAGGGSYNLLHLGGHSDPGGLGPGPATSLLPGLGTGALGRPNRHRLRQLCLEEIEIPQGLATN